MNKQFRKFIPDDYNDNSRVWVYQSDRPFTIDEAMRIKEQLKAFSLKWHSHGDTVKNFGHLFFDRFIILMADESETVVGGCSTDSSIHFLKNIEKDYSVQLFNRQILAFIINEKIETIPLEKVNTAIEEELINGETLYFNNTILTKRDLLDKWIIPVKDSWLAGRIPKFTPIK